MTERHNLKILSRDSNNESVTTTINYVNGSLSAGDYVDIAVRTNALTSMSYVSSQLVSTIDLDELATNRNAQQTQQQAPNKSVSPFAKKV